MEKINKEIEEFKMGIFSLNTRRFGTLAELMIQLLYKLFDSRNLAFDKKNKQNKKVEIKFSRVMKKNKETIKIKNVISQAKKANTKERMVKFSDEAIFDCNIQQIKTKDFDVLYYGLFFDDKILIYKIDSKDVKSIPGYSNKQHRGNEGEGQFHINNTNINIHKKYLDKELSYEDLYEMFS